MSPVTPLTPSIGDSLWKIPNVTVGPSLMASSAFHLGISTLNPAILESYNRISQRRANKPLLNSAPLHNLISKIPIMAAPALPASLTPALSDRDAIADALYRGVNAFDTADEVLFKSALTEDAVLVLNGTVMEGYDAIYSGSYVNIAKMDTNHFLTNLRINITGESKAQVSCSALSQHYRGGEGMKPGADFLLAGGLYAVELVKDAGDGLWKIKHWTLKTTWAQGDWAVFGK